MALAFLPSDHKSRMISGIEMTDALREDLKNYAATGAA